VTIGVPDVIGQALAEKAAAAAREADAAKRDSYLIGLMRESQGRQFVWETLLDGGGLFSDCRRWRNDGTLDVDGSAFAYAEGALARATWNRLWQACPSAVGVMVAEAASRNEAKKAHQ
jgi:hypothetical protein